MILVCGDAMTDSYWSGDVSRISPEAPVPVVSVLRQEERPGAADNVAANCISLGAEVKVVTCNTARKIRLVARNQQVARIDFDRTATNGDTEELEYRFFKHLPLCEIVIFSDYGKGSLRNIQRLIEAARRAGKTTLVDPKGHDYTRYCGASLVKPNTHELKEMVGGWRDADQLSDKASKLIRETGIERILLTQASEGMTLFDKDGSFHFPALAKEVYDVTGAGDTAIATLAVSLSMGHSWSKAVHYANKAAGIAVGHFGTYVAKKEEVFDDLA